MSQFIELSDYDASIHRDILDALTRNDEAIVEICEDRAIAEMRGIIHTDVEYAYIHNYGGNINHPITRKQRVKGLALTPRTSYTIKMPQRRFIGPGRELKEKLQKMAEKDISNLLNK